jgi:hypothetical protein
MTFFCVRRPARGAAAERYSPNTESTMALRYPLSSGALIRLACSEAIATYCLPLNSNAIGGAEKREPTLIFHISSSVVSSKAATVPSSKARNRRPPAARSGYASATRWRLADED